MASDKLVIGLTGGIGSGKSAVAAIFSQLGIAVIDADIAARKVTEPGQIALHQLVAHFGKEILTSSKNPTLDRQKLRSIIFSDPNERRWLNNLLHPLIRKWMSDQVAIVNVESEYIIQVIPLLFESGLEKEVDRILVIDTNEITQKKRLLQRDNSSAAEIDNIIQSQSSRQQRLDGADDIISNHSRLEDLEIAVKKMHNKYLLLAQPH